jgi:hypothetical protein
LQHNHQSTYGKDKSMVDPFCIIGCIVTAKTCHITSFAEYACTFGLGKSTNTLNGIDTKVVGIQNDENN